MVGPAFAMSSSATRRTPRGAWVSPATGSPLHSPFSKPSNHFTNYNWDTPRTSRNIFSGWKTLKEAIKEGTLTSRWRNSSNFLTDNPPDGLWSELHRAQPVKAQIPREKDTEDKIFGTHVGIWFVIGEPFAKGGFGEVRYGYHKSMSAKKFAVKIESVNHTGMRHLSAEYNIYSILGDSPGIPRCYYYGLCGIVHNALVMDLLGPSLDDIFEQMKRKFSVRTVILIALQCFERLQYLHTRGVVHGDVKGENFLVGMPNEGMDNVIYIVDFGLSQVLKDHVKGTYLYNENSIVCPSGTPRYMSVSAHSGNALSYRDDLESLAYVLVYFLKGRLPWQGIHEKDTSKKSAIIKARKSEEPPESICSSTPEEFAQLLKYSRTLKFQDEPDYVYLKTLFRDLLTRHENQLKAEAATDAALANAENDENQEVSPGRAEPVPLPVGFDWVGKTFNCRKEPTKHPILPRAEFQKKISVPSLSPIPGDKLQLIHKQRSSAHQLSIVSKQKSQKSKSARLQHSPSVPHVFVNISGQETPPSSTLEEHSSSNKQLNVPLAKSYKSSPDTNLPSPRITKNSIDLSLDDDGEMLSVNEYQDEPQPLRLPVNVPSRESSGVTRKTSTERTRKISIASLPPAPGDIKIPEVTSIVTVDEVSTPLNETPMTSHTEIPRRNDDHTSFSGSSVSYSATSQSVANTTGNTDSKTRKPTPPHNVLPPLVTEMPDNKPRKRAGTMEKKGSGAQESLPPIHRKQPKVQPPSYVVASAKAGKEVNLARTGLKNSGQVKKPDTRKGSGAPGVEKQPNTDKTLVRINVFDVKRDGDGGPGADAMINGGCFTWLKRRARCGANGTKTGSAAALTAPPYKTKTG